MIQTFDYDIHYYPAMPVVEVEVKQVGQDGGERVVALVDSGADATLIPLKVLQQLKVEQTGWSNMRGVSGISYRVPMYIAALKIGVIDIFGIRAIGDRQNQDMIIGRDVLNQLIVTLNGLAQVVELSQ